MRRHPFWNLCAHASIIGSAMFLLFFTIDQFNPAMEFLTSAISKWFLCAYCLVSLIASLNAAMHIFYRTRSSERSQSVNPHATHAQHTRVRHGQTGDGQSPYNHEYAASHYSPPMRAPQRSVYTSERRSAR